jgi:putative transcriptional regulator
MVKRSRGARIKQAREKADWTQAELAERVGVRRNTINRVENDLSRPSLALLEKIAQALKIKLADIV